MYVAGLVSLLVLYSYVEHKRQKGVLSFSSTQQLDANLLRVSKKNPEYDAIVTNFPYDGRNIEQELRYLLSLKTLRTDKKISEIKKEAQDSYLDYILNKVLISQTDRIYINKLFKNIVDPIIMRKKIKYDRVRPSFLNEDIEPVIDVPNHPAYPSGHATQMYFIANYLILKYNIDIFHIASRIAKNREIAGLHYPSDTKYGKQLGHSIATYVFQNNL